MNLFWSIYEFLFHKDFRDWVLSKPQGDIGRLRTIICRLRAHPAGVKWYCYGQEPDMHCKNCNDDLS